MSYHARSLFTRAAGIALLATLFGGVAFVAPTQAPALYLDDEVIPGKPLTNGGIEWMDIHRQNVVHRVYLLAGQQATFYWSSDDPALNCDIELFGPSANDFTATELGSSSNPGNADEQIVYFVPSSGWYYLRVEREWDAGNSVLRCNTTWPVPRTPATPQRVSGRDRYETAVEIARQNFPGWRNVKHVIICSGEDRAAADPLSASGLAWAYGAPVFLVKSTGTPDCVVEALHEISAQNRPFALHIVGGPNSVTPAAMADIDPIVLGVIYDRIAPYNDRYTLAASVARRMSAERDRNTYSYSTTGYGIVLVANGEDPSKFFDALALSPVCATTGWPILLVRKNSIPAPTQQAMDDLDLTWRLVAGGPNTVSDAVIAQLDPDAITLATRISGNDRYETAAAVMNFFNALWGVPPLDPANVGVTAKLPDALTGGSTIGLRRGCLLLTRTSSLPWASASFLGHYTEETGRAYVFGGPNSVDADAIDAIQDALDP